jgi:hypothetical protein
MLTPLRHLILTSDFSGVRVALHSILYLLFGLWVTFYTLLTLPFCMLTPPKLLIPMVFPGFRVCNDTCSSRMRLITVRSRRLFIEESLFQIVHLITQRQGLSSNLDFIKRKHKATKLQKYEIKVQVCKI